MHRSFNASEWLVDRHVESGDGERLAIRCQGRSFTYGDVQAPQAFEIVSELPKTATGEIQRYKLRGSATARAGDRHQ